MIRATLKEVNLLEEKRKIDDFLNSQFIIRSLNWITKLASASDPLRSIVGNQLISSYQNAFHFDEFNEKIVFFDDFISHLTFNQEKVNQDIKKFQENKTINFLDGMGSWLPRFVSESLSLLYLQVPIFSIIIC